MAQAVYSQNVVGYVNYTQPANSFRLVATPLNTTNNDVSNIFANGATTYLGLTIYKRNSGGTGYDSAYYDGDLSAWSQALDLAPGAGYWVSTPPGIGYTNTFVGEVMQGALSQSLPAGYSLQGSKVPQAAALVGVMNFPYAAGDVIYFQNSSFTGYDEYYIDQDLGAWTINDPIGPVPAVGQGFWVLNAGATKNWTRNFTVN